MSGPSPLFSPGERLGIFLTIETSLLSVASVTFILYYALYRRLKALYYTSRRKNLGPRMPSDATSSGLFLNLMLADLIQALGNLPDIRWMAAGAVLPGTRLCAAQALLKQVGIVGVSLTSLAIAFHTFSILVLRRKGPPNLPKYAIIGIWVITALDIGIPNLVHRNEAYYGKTGYWCWILPHFQPERIVTEYLWVWLAGLFMIILYGIMFAVIRRWINIAHGIHWYNQRYKNASEIESEDDKKIKAIANSMLFYPAVYMVCVFPTTIARWLFFTDDPGIAYQFTLFASTIYGLSGMFNLILFFLTRPTVVVGHSTSLKDVALSFHRRQDSESSWNSLQKEPRLDYGHGIPPTNDVENLRQPWSTFELQSPSRSMYRTRSSYDLQGVSSLLSSPAHHRRASSSGVLDIINDKRSMSTLS